MSVWSCRLQHTASAFFFFFSFQDMAGFPTESSWSRVFDLRGTAGGCFFGIDFHDFSRGKDQKERIKNSRWPEVWGLESLERVDFPTESSYVLWTG